MIECVLQTKGVSKGFSEKLAANRVTVSIKQGDIGGNEAGKTTLMRIVCGLAEPTSGYMSDRVKLVTIPPVSVDVTHEIIVTFVWGIASIAVEMAPFKKMDI